MAGNSKRDIIQIESTAGTGYRYSITKNKRLHPDRVEYKKYDPVVRKHVIFKETKSYLKRVIKDRDEYMKEFKKSTFGRTFDFFRKKKGD